MLTIQRSQILSLLQTNTNTTYVEIVVFVILYISKFIKTSILKFHQNLLKLLTYLSDKLLCVFRMIKLYSCKTSNLRNRDMYSFFISYVAPYKLVTRPSTVRIGKFCNKPVQVDSFNLSISNWTL